MHKLEVCLLLLCALLCVDDSSSQEEMSKLRAQVQELKTKNEELAKRTPAASPAPEGQ